MTIRLALLLTFAVGVASAQDRFALVIGNGKYPGAAALNNPTNDASAVASALEKLDFKVTKKTDVGLGGMEDALTEFCRSLKKGSVALFYFDGHGLQVKGENFVVPVDADLKEGTHVAQKCLPVGEIVEELNKSSAAVKLIVLDACRSNPFLRDGASGDAKRPGLAPPPDLPANTAFILASSPGKTLPDSATERVSPFTKQLLVVISRRPGGGLKVVDAFRDLSKAVRADTGQIPWLSYDAAMEDVYLWQDGAKVASAPKPPPKPAEPPRAQPEPRSAEVAKNRFALVIGNGKYPGAAALNNPTNDAAAVAAALEKLDFQVTKKTDLGLSDMEDATAEFCKSLKKRSVALFFYAGHGLQVKNENFLVPLDADVKEESQVKRKCYPVEEVLSELDSSNAALKIVILDSCRDNPLTRSWKRSAESGLASIGRIPSGTIIAFSTAPGEAALDGRGANSPFTKHLVASLERRPKEGLEVIQALRVTGQAVSKEIGQRPWLNFDTSLEDFYLWNSSSTEPEGGALGIMLDQNEETMRVVNVKIGSGAEKAGLSINDIVKRIDGKAMVTRRELMDAVRRYPPGAKVELLILRDQRELTVSVVLDKATDILGVPKTVK